MKLTSKHILYAIALLLVANLVCHLLLLAASARNRERLIELEQQLVEQGSSGVHGKTNADADARIQALERAVEKVAGSIEGLKRAAAEQQEEIHENRRELVKLHGILTNSNGPSSVAEEAAP